VGIDVCFKWNEKEIIKLKIIGNRNLTTTSSVSNGWCSMYYWKALYKEGCTPLIHGVWTYGVKKHWILKFLWVKEIKNHFYFYFDCGNGTGLTLLYSELSTS